MWYWNFWRRELLKNCFYQLLQIAAQSAGTGEKAAVDKYLKIEELPSGRGIADVVYLPKQKSPLPALVIELKWNQSSGGAVEQIRRKNYPAVLQDCGSEIMMVGINYDAKTKNTSAGLRGSERQVVPVPAGG